MKGIAIMMIACVVTIVLIGSSNKNSNKPLEVANEDWNDNDLIGQETLKHF